MRFARIATVTAACVALAAMTADCSGSFGSGTGLPNTVASPNFGGNGTPSPAPSAASAIVTYGESTSFQALPEVGGYGGAIAFPKAPAPGPEPAAKGKGAAAHAEPTPVSVAIGATLSIVKPADGPDLNLASGRGRRRKTREKPARALAWVTLLPTHDVTLESYPRFALDVPRDVAAQYRDGEFGLALWNSGEKDRTYRLAVSELEGVTTPPPAPKPSGGSAGPSPAPGATTTPSPAVSPSPSRSPGAAGPFGAGSIPGSARPSGAPLPNASPTLPPQRLLFAGTASALKLVANRPLVFALYALPHPAGAASAAPESPAGKGRRGRTRAAAEPSPAAAASPASTAQPSPAAGSSAPSPATSAPR
ncbi:MAG: hypothetical protein JOZ24_08695 [Candidatus Eremiobacteraeota bacterium]|nr:hypothetical protein [Candidatus Eremiobacteraeota bacterium]